MYEAILCKTEQREMTNSSSAYFGEREPRRRIFCFFLELIAGITYFGWAAL